MTYQVRFLPPALDDLDAAYEWAATGSPHKAAQWLDRFHLALATLESHPRRCPVAPENRKTARELRQLLYGKRPNVFRAVFTVEGNTVWVIRIRRAQRRTLTADEIPAFDG